MLLRYLQPMITLVTFFSILCGIIYPALITLILQLACPNMANGSLIKADNHFQGSFLIGQSFTSEKYFWSRPSATLPFPYNAEYSKGSNLCTTNPLLLSRITTRIAAIKEQDRDNMKLIPIDLVTSSGSGLDPDISLASVEYQIPRIARARNIDEVTIKSLVNTIAKGRQFGILGEPRVNVVELNLNLDRLQ